MAGRSYFLSSTNRPLAAFRAKVRERLANGSAVQVTDQHSAVRDGETLVRLYEEIRLAGGVIHLVGPEAGAPVVDEHVSNLLNHVRPARRFAIEQICTALGDRSASFTQWEALLAHALGRRLLVFVQDCDEDLTPRAPTGSGPLSTAEHLHLIGETWKHRPHEHAFDPDGPSGAAELVIAIQHAAFIEEPEELDPIWRAVDAGFLDRLATASDRPADQPLDDEALAAYFDGGAASWLHALDSRIPMLPLGDELLADVSPTSEGFDLILSPTGEGKTTLLHQVAARVARQGALHVMQFVRSEPLRTKGREPGSAQDVAQALAALPEEGTALLVIDQADRHVHWLAALLSRHTKVPVGSRRLHVLAAARDSEWSRAGGASGPWAGVVPRVRSRSVDASDALRLVQAWATLGERGLGALAGCSRDEAAEALHRSIAEARDGEGSLFAGCLDARFPDETRLRRHQRDLLVKLHRDSRDGPDLYRAFVAVALAQVLKARGLSTHVVSHLADADPNRFSTQLEQPLGREAPITPGDGDRRVHGRLAAGLTTRHLRIAQATVAICALPDPELPDEDLADLLLALVSTAQRLADSGTFIPHHGALMLACETALLGALNDLVPRAAQEELALGVTSSLCEQTPKLSWYFKRIEVLNLCDRQVDAYDAALAWAGDGEQGFEAVREHARARGATPDIQEYIRGFYGLWARAGMEIPLRTTALYLALRGLSDQLVESLPGIPQPLPALFVGRFAELLVTIARAEPRLAQQLPPEDGLDAVARALIDPDGSLDVPPPTAEELIDSFGPLLTLVRPDRPPLPDDDSPFTFEAFKSAWRVHVEGRFGPMLRHMQLSVGEGARAYFRERYEGRDEIQLYDHQELAFDAIELGLHVVLNTPTGSGKSEVALAAHFAALKEGQRSVYTAPTKALVNEKFFDLAGHVGYQRVGLITGDVSINPEAPVLCCTAEILARMVRRQGAAADFAWVVMDEFHYFGDRERGEAWLVPLVEMSQTRFLLISATLHAPRALAERLEQWTGGEVELIAGDPDPERPGQFLREPPLKEEFKHDLLFDQAVERLLEQGRDPVYVVCFARAEASQRAGSLAAGRKPKQLVEGLKAGKPLRAEILRQAAFNTPFGKRLRPLLEKGVGIHHGGMLPKYRRIVEKLAKASVNRDEARALAVISGTNTLGVGVDLPIQTVLMSALAYVRGTKRKKNSTEEIPDWRLIKAQEYRQLAGRAGRKGYHEAGHVWVLPPEHVVKHASDKRKAEAKNRKPPPLQHPPGMKIWTEETLERLQHAEPEPLVPRLELTPRFVLDFLARPGDGRQQLTRFVESTGLPDADREAGLRRADELYDALSTARLVEPRPDATDEQPGYQVHRDLDGLLDRPLGMFLDYALLKLPPELHDQAGVLAVVEAVIACDRSILVAQDRRAQEQAYQDFGLVDRDDLGRQKERDDAVDAAGRERPLEDELEAWFGEWVARHPGLAPRDEAPNAKWVAGEMYSHDQDFSEYVKACAFSVRNRQTGTGAKKRVSVDLSDNENGLLYYLSNVYRTLVRFLPPVVQAWDGVEELTEWLGAVIRQADSSLVDEWTRLGGVDPGASGEAILLSDAQRDITQEPGFAARVRKEAFDWIKALFNGSDERLAALVSTRPSDDGEQEQVLGITLEQVHEGRQRLVDDIHQILIDADARGPQFFAYDPAALTVVQTVHEPQDQRNWRLVGRVDPVRSRELDTAVLVLESIERLGD